MGTTSKLVGACSNGISSYSCSDQKPRRWLGPPSHGRICGQLRMDMKAKLQEQHVVVTRQLDTAHAWEKLARICWRKSSLSKWKMRISLINILMRISLIDILIGCSFGARHIVTSFHWKWSGMHPIQSMWRNFQAVTKASWVGRRNILYTSNYNARWLRWPS